MRWHVFAAVGLAAAVAAPAQAQVGGYRRFTTEPGDTNRSNKIVYVPVARAFSGSRPTQQPYDVAVASWYVEPLGSRNDRPDNKLDDAEYVLETFEAVKAEGERLPTMRVVVTRRPAPPEGTAPPELTVLHRKTLISSRGMARVEPIADGVRYTFTLKPPLAEFGPAALSTPSGASPRYELSLFPAREVRLPRHITKAPTFSGGEDPETRMLTTPRAPRLPEAERVAGKRFEFRNNRVVERK